SSNVCQPVSCPVGTSFCFDLGDCATKTECQRAGGHCKGTECNSAAETGVTVKSIIGARLRSAAAVNEGIKHQVQELIGELEADFLRAGGGCAGELAQRVARSQSPSRSINRPGTSALARPEPKRSVRHQNPALRSTASVLQPIRASPSSAGSAPL